MVWTLVCHHAAMGGTGTAEPIQMDLQSGLTETVLPELIVCGAASDSHSRFSHCMVLHLSLH